MYDAQYRDSLQYDSNSSLQAQLDYLFRDSAEHVDGHVNFQVCQPRHQIDDDQGGIDVKTLFRILNLLVRFLAFTV